MSLWERIKFVLGSSSVVRSYSTLSREEFAKMWNDNLEEMKILACECANLRNGSIIEFDTKNRCKVCKKQYPVTN